MCTIDKDIKALLGFQRLPVEMFRKLQWLRDEEEGKSKGVSFKKKFMDDLNKDLSFFTEDLAECEMDDEGRLGDDELTQ